MESVPSQTNRAMPAPAAPQPTVKATPPGYVTLTDLGWTFFSDAVGMGAALRKLGWRDPTGRWEDAALADGRVVLLHKGTFMGHQAQPQPLLHEKRAIAALESAGFVVIDPPGIPSALKQAAHQVAKQVVKPSRKKDTPEDRAARLTRAIGSFGYMTWREIIARPADEQPEAARHAAAALMVRGLSPNEALTVLGPYGPPVRALWDRAALRDTVADSSDSARRAESSGGHDATAVRRAPRRL